MTSGKKIQLLKVFSQFPQNLDKLKLQCDVRIRYMLITVNNNYAELMIKETAVAEQEEN